MSEAKTYEALPLFEGHKVATQRLKLTGSVDKDEFVAEPHDGDTIVFFTGKARLGNVGHEFIEDGTIRMERLNVLDIIVQTNDSDTIASLYTDLAGVEVEIRRERSGVASLDDAMDERSAENQAGDAAAAAGTEVIDPDSPAADAAAAEHDAGDEVARARAARAKTPAKPKTPSKPAHKATKSVAKPRKSPTKK